MLSVVEAMTLYRGRWQIELLFKLFKSHGKIDKWTSQKKWRILCEIYAKLLAMVIQHWLLLCSGIACPYHSLTRAAKAVKKHAMGLAAAMASGLRQTLIATIETVAPSLMAGTRIYKRNDCTTTYQRLLQVTTSLPLSS